jgi:hypothetical protein
MCLQYVSLIASEKKSFFLIKTYKFYYQMTNRPLGSWMMTSPVIWQYRNIIWVAGWWLLSYDSIRVAGWWCLLSYDSIRVAGWWLLLSYDSIETLSAPGFVNWSPWYCWKGHKTAKIQITTKNTQCTCNQE